MSTMGYIQVVRRCNQQCVFCSNPDNDQERTLAEVTDILTAFAAAGMTDVMLSGGEPTLHPDLPAIIRHARQCGLTPRVITNGQWGLRPGYAAALVAAGLDHIHVSVHSHVPAAQAALTGVPESLARIHAALAALAALPVTVDLNVTLNARNAAEIDPLVAEFTSRYPSLRHFVFNNLDPLSERARAHPEVLASPAQFEISLRRALDQLAREGRTYRVERVPLCYMVEHAFAATETRKLVKADRREIAFLDERGQVDDRAALAFYGKAAACAVCRLNGICVGVAGPDVFDVRAELYPVFVDPEPIQTRILGG